MRVLAIFGFICFLTINGAAQNGYSISGIVSNSSGPVKGAIVTLTPEGDTNPKYTKETNDEGFYGFYAAPGKYVLKAAKKRNGNVVSSAMADVEVRVGNHESINVTIAEPPMIRETITISADSNQTIDQVSKTVNIIEGQEMRERADFSLADTLRTIPGFRVQQLGGFGRTATIKTRGLRNQDTAILIDGIRLRDASAITGDASPFLSDITLTSVSRIEVLRGSGSSLYGTNAIGGTLDFQTPKPQSGLHGQASFAYGGYGLKRFRGNISDGTSDGKFAFNLAAARTAYTKGIDGQDNAHNTNFQSRLEYDPFSKTNISGRFFVSDAFVRLNSEPDTLGALPPTNATIIEAEPGVNFAFDANDPDDSQRSQFFSGQFVLTQIINDKLFFQGSYQGLRTSRKNTNGPLGVGFQPFGGEESSIFLGQIHTTNGHFNWTPNSNNQIKIGYEYEWEKFGNDGFTIDGVGNFSTRAKQASSTFFVQDLVGLFNDRLQIAGGFRAQWFSLKDPALSALNPPYNNLTLENPPSAYTFDGAVSYFFQSTGTKLRAHVGNGYRVPSLFERFGSFYAIFLFPNRFVPMGAPDLKPERSIAFDAGVEQRLFSDRATLSAVYFYTRLTDIISFGTLPQPDPWGRDNFLSGGGYLNTKGGIARGGEFSARTRPTSSTDIFVSYTFTNSDQRTPQIAGSGIVESLAIPKHQFTLVATQRFERFWVNFDLLATSVYLGNIFSNSVFSNFVYRFKGNRRADVTAGYTFPLNKDRMNLRLFGTIENLFGHEYYENGFQTPDRNARVGLSFGF